jgi:two-component system, OmpR family, response regulator
MLATKAKILVVDDEPDALQLIQFNLKNAGFKVLTAKSGEEALSKANSNHPDLIVLDIMLPGVDGLEICKMLKREAKTASIPIIMVTARATEIDRVLGLELGADDYVTKPFSPRELVARVQAILKRTGARQPAAREIKELAHGAARINVYGHAAYWKDKAVALTATEFAILKSLLQEPQRVFSRDRLMDAAYDGQVSVSDRTIDSHMRNLRAKYAKAGCKDLVETVHGVGYKLGPCR